MKLMYVPLEKLKPKIHVRRDLGDIDKLADSIRKNGVLVPLLVSESDNGEYYEIICGYRRYLAAIKAGLSELPAKSIGHISVSEALRLLWEEDELKKRFMLDERCLIIAALVEEYGLRRVSRELGYPASTIETMVMAGKTFAGVWSLVRSSNIVNSQNNIKFKVKLKLAEEVSRAVLKAGYSGERFKELAARIYLTLMDLSTKTSIEILRKWVERPTLDYLDQLIVEFKERHTLDRPTFKMPKLEERVPIELKGGGSLEKLLMDAAWDRMARYTTVEQFLLNIIEFGDEYAGISGILCPRCSRPLRCRVCGSIVNCLCGYPHGSVRNRKYRYADLEVCST